MYVLPCLLTRTSQQLQCCTAAATAAASKRGSCCAALRCAVRAAGGDMGAGGAAAGRKNVDLDNLTFHQGAHFNSSKTCTLPQVSHQ